MCGFAPSGLQAEASLSRPFASDRRTLTREGWRRVLRRNPLPLLSRRGDRRQPGRWDKRRKPEGCLAERIIVYWRDIPAQVIVKAGRRSVAKRELPVRFMQAIDATRNARRR